MRPPTRERRQGNRGNPYTAPQEERAAADRQQDGRNAGTVYQDKHPRRTANRQPLTQHRRTNPSQAGQQAKQGKRPLASKPPPQLLQDFRQPLSAVANSQPERANTPPNPQQGNPTPPQTPHPYFEAVELIVSRICAKPYVFPQKAKTPLTTPKERPRIDV